MKLEICSFSGYKIYPGKGKTYVRTDNKIFKFVTSKAASLFLQRLNPRKIHWTVVFRRIRKKGITEEQAKKRTRRTVKVQRAIAGTTLDQLKAKKNQRPEVREAARKQAIEAAKAKKKDELVKKAATKEAQKSQPKVSKQQAKGVKPAVQARTR